MMEKKGAGFHTSSSTFWDPESDSATSYRWENKARTGLGLAFGYFLFFFFRWVGGGLCVFWLFFRVEGC